MKRLVWFALGVGVTAVVVLKAKDLYRKATPAGMQQQFAATADKAQSGLSEFFATVKSAAAERELELREALGLDDEGAALTEEIIAGARRSV